MTESFLVRDLYLAGKQEFHQHRPPSYALSPLGPVPAVPSGAGPSALLIPRYELVPFTGRAAERAGLNDWLGSATDTAVRLITGAGGQGKTRLALRVARDAAAKGWGVLLARHRLDGGLLARSAGEYQPSERASGLLIVVDYAERWPYQDTLELFERLGESDGKGRILLLARSGQFWPTLAGPLAEAGVEVSRYELATVTAEVEDLPGMFTAAVGAFAAHLGAPIPPALPAPPAGLMLSVQVAALATVLASMAGETRPDVIRDPAVASRYLLAREVRHWQRMRAADPDPVRVDTRTMARAVLVATLVRGLPLDAALRLLDRLELGTPAQMVADDHARCYPSADGDAVLEPLAPDRLGEDFVASVLCAPEDERARAVQPDLVEIADPAAGRRIVDRILGLGDEQQAEPFEVLGSTLTTLVETSRRWPSVAAGYLVPALREAPVLALTCDNETIARLCGIDGIEPALRPVGRFLDSFLGAGSNLNLDFGAVAVAEKLVELARAGNDPDELGLRLHMGAIRQASVGRYDEALAWSEEATGIFRSLAARQGRSTGALSMLAMSLTSVANHLAELGRQREALSPSEEALEIYRTLTDPSTGDPDGFRDGLAGALNNHGKYLAELGRPQDALPPTEEALAIYRELAASETDDPAAFRPLLALLLNNVALRLVDLGRTREALAPLRESVDLRRKLAAPRTGSPAIYLPDLSVSLNNLGNLLSVLGELDEAIAVTREAVEIRRMASNPEGGNPAYLPRLAVSLSNLGERLLTAGRPAEAIAPIEEALELLRGMAGAPARLPSLARCLSHLAQAKIELGHAEEAILPATEAADIRRRLAESEPAAYLPDLARSWQQMAGLMAAAGRHGESLTLQRQAIALYRDLSGRSPVHHRHLAEALADLAGSLLQAGDLEEAPQHAWEAVEIYRRLADPEGANSDLAVALNVLGICLASAGKPLEAVPVMREAVRVFRQCAALHASNRKKLLQNLVGVSSNLANLLAQLGREDEALAVASAARQTVRSLAV